MNLDNNSFKDFTSGELVLVDFYADWCGPCKMMHPILEQISEIKVGKINVDNEQGLAQTYGVMSIPTLILYKNGEVVDKKIGFVSREELDTWINTNK